MNILSFKRNWQRRAGMWATGLMLTCSSHCFAQTSPVGVWDCIIGGAQKGVAYITFNSDNTLTGYEAVLPRIPGPVGSSDRGGDGIGRGDEDSGGGNGSGNTNLIGFVYLVGQWAYDAKGHLVGNLAEVNENVSCEDTEEVVTTYATNIVDGEIQVSVSMMTNIITTCTTNGFTNGFSFVGIAKPGRLSMKTTAANGRRSNIKGVPAVTLNDFSGSYLAQGRKNGIPITEFYSFTPDPEPGFINSYYTDGTGPAYDVTGYAIFSGRNKMIWIIYREDPTVPLISVFGSYNVSKGKAKLSGKDSTDIEPANYSYKLTAQSAFD